MAFQDYGYNLLIVPVTIKMLGYQEPEVVDQGSQLDIYKFIIEDIRIEDQQRGNLFLKRFLAGQQEFWDQTQRSIYSLKNLTNVKKVPDQYLQYFKQLFGWTPDLNAITDRLDNNSLRRLIASSVPLWKTRGTEDSLVNVITFATKSRSRIQNWFHYRWIIDETGLSYEFDDFDPWTSGVDDQSTYNLRVVDDGTLDRALIRRLAALMRPSGERIEAVYLLFLDEFTEAGDNSQWTTQEAIDPVIDFSVNTSTSSFDYPNQELRAGLYKITFVPNYASSAMVTSPSASQYLIAFKNPNYSISNGLYLQNASGTIYLTISTNSHAISFPVTFSASQSCSIEVNWPALTATLTGFTTGNFLNATIAGSFPTGSDDAVYTAAKLGAPFILNSNGMAFDGTITAITRPSPVIANTNPLLVSNQQAQLTSANSTMLAVATVGGATNWNSYMINAKIRGDAGFGWGMAFYVKDPNNYYVVYAHSDFTWKFAKVRGGGLTNLATGTPVDGLSIYIGINYGLRITTTPVSAGTEIVVYIDGSELIRVTDATFSSGSVAIARLNKSAQLTVGEVEVMGLPSTFDLVGLGS